MKHPVFIGDTSRTKTWAHIDGDMYLATGVDANGKRFRIMSPSWGYISGINLWRGSKWIYRKGCRYLISRTVN